MGTDRATIDKCMKFKHTIILIDAVWMPRTEIEEMVICHVALAIYVWHFLVCVCAVRVCVRLILMWLNAYAVHEWNRLTMPFANACSSRGWHVCVCSAYSITASNYKWLDGCVCSVHYAHCTPSENRKSAKLYYSRRRLLTMTIDQMSPFRLQSIIVTKYIIM